VVVPKNHHIFVLKPHHDVGTTHIAGLYPVENKKETTMITTLLTALSLLFHTLATIVMVGHYLLLAAAYLPALRRSLDAPTLSTALAAMNSGIRSRMLPALLVFAVTGFYLMTVNSAYHGLGQFSNAWSLLMLVKHLLIVVMVVLGFRFNNSFKPNEPLPAGFDAKLVAVFVCGVLVLLLTAFAQAQ
jgi:uncharacterized membrane protein